MGLERTIFTVSEDVGVVELCARVFEPDIDCPIEFPFNVILSSTDRTAGTYTCHILTGTDVSSDTLLQRVLWIMVGFLQP